MDERRSFFRLKNNGEILAKISSQYFEIIDISATGARITNNAQLADEGTIEISINRFSIEMHYKILRFENNSTIIIFTNDAEINRIFVALKQLRDERRAHNP
ncbi:PilZ domain-containing protein [Legionella sp. km535]|uniref:PilZ domain-containing protein n=1 Tax=Legionella sp. km535 TaxID=2498107 RepID=UPI000F8D85B6|nr:PilZ domain-containing protein [Legionella sp. km535]RUR18128.1 PilZ domain-containing protein [Legionella sp. km535]